MAETEQYSSDEAREIQAFIALFIVEDAQLYLTNDHAITADMRKAVLSHLQGKSFWYRVNYQGKPGKKRKKIAGAYLGASPLDLNNMVRWTCLDLDGSGHASPLAHVEETMRRIISAALELGLEVYWEVSKGGTGRHVWLFFPKLIKASEARALGLFIAPKDAPCIVGPRSFPKNKGFANPYTSAGIEVFPKQKQRGLGGNPVYLSAWCKAEPGRLQLHDCNDQAVAFSEVRRCNEEDLDASLLKALEVETQRELLLCKANQKRIEMVQSIKKRPTKQIKEVTSTSRKDSPPPRITITTKETHSEASEDLERLCKKIVSAKNRAPVFGYLCGIASWVKSGWISEEEAREKALDACGQNPSASKWPSSDQARWWCNALIEAEPKKHWLAELYLKQLEDEQSSEELITRKPQEHQRSEAAKVIFEYMTGQRQGVGIPAYDPGIGKTSSVILSSRLLEGHTILALPSHDLARLVVGDAATNFGITTKRIFSPTADRGLLDKDGLRVCKKDQDQLAAERYLGIHGKRHCKGCRLLPNCEAAKGFVGDENAKLIIATHDGLHDIGNGYKVLDEFKQVYVSHKVVKGDLEDVKKGKGAIEEKYAQIFIAQAKALLDGQMDQWQDTTALSKELKGKVPTTSNPAHGFQRLQHRGAWRAIRWILDAGNAPIKPSQDGLGWEYVLPHSSIASLSQGGLILNGLADERMKADLEKCLSINVSLERLAVTEKVSHKRIWRPTTRASRKFLIPGGTLDEEALAPLLAALVADIRSNCESKKVLLASHRPVINALNGTLGNELRALVASRGGQLALLYWGGKGIEGSNEYIGFDTAYTVGDPLSGPDPSPDQPETENWERARSKAAKALAQFFARLRHTEASTQLRMVHLGCVLPMGGWLASNTEIEYTGPGRPKKEKEIEKTTFPPKFVAFMLGSLIEENGFRETMKNLNLSQRALNAFLKSEREPSPELLGELLSSARQKVLHFEEELESITLKLVSLFPPAQTNSDKL